MAISSIHYFYYFIDSSGLYYGGITNNIARRQREHRSDQRLGLKSTTKDWHLLQDPITLTTVWTFEAKKEAAVYEKQWVINNYQSPLCLNHLRNGGYQYKKHKELCEAGGGKKSAPLFLICTKTRLITKIESTCDGERQGFGPGRNLPTLSKPNCLHRAKTHLAARSEVEAKAKLEAWLLIPGNSTIDNPIILALPEEVSPSTLHKLAGVTHSTFSRMYNKAGDWLQCTKALDVGY